MLKLNLVSLGGVKLDTDVYEVILPTSEGNIAVYEQHMPLVTTLVPGVITVRRKKSDPDSEVDDFAVSGGVAEVGSQTVRVLVDQADHSEEIVEAEVREALENAKRIRDEAKDKVELDKAQELIDRQSVRLKVGELRRRRKGL